MLASSSTATPRERERAPQRVLQPRGDVDRRRPRSGAPATQHGELVAAEPGEGVAAPQRGPQPLGDLDQQRVAVVVAERVVDLLEAVEVDQQHRGRVRRRAARARRGACSRVRLGRPVSASCSAWWRSAARGAGDDPEQRAEEAAPGRRRAAAQSSSTSSRISAATGVVAHVDLEHAGRRAAGREPDRHVDLEHALAACRRARCRSRGCCTISPPAPCRRCRP